MTNIICNYTLKSLFFLLQKEGKIHKEKKEYKAKRLFLNVSPRYVIENETRKLSWKKSLKLSPYKNP